MAPLVTDSSIPRVALMAVARTARLHIILYSSAHIINFEWLQHEAGPNKIFSASAELKDAIGRTVVTSYVVKRPDGNWSLMLTNHDLKAAHPVGPVIDDAKHVSHSFIGPVSSRAVLQHP